MNDLDALSLGTLATFDFRRDDRDRAVDVRAVHDRVAGALAGLPDAVWGRVVSESAVAGAPGWTVRDHVGHVIDWLEEAVGYTRAVCDGARWPADDDYGDMDTRNEERRSLFAGSTPSTLRARYDAATDTLLDAVLSLAPEDAASDDAWEWAWFLLLGHPAEHVAVIEAVVAAAAGPDA